MKEYCNKKLIGNVTKETFAYEIVVKNNRKTPVQIDVEDQLPISTQSDIIVDAEEISKAQYDSKTGKLTWTFLLQPGEVKKIALSYSVKYPKNTNVKMEKYRAAYSPSF